ncbi:MAG: MarR family winged helix-turn-helix transcriptional regulator, partial [Bacillota bacterium]
YRESPMFWLRRAYLAARKALDEGLHEHQLTGSQFEVLRQVLMEDGVEQRTLQERLRIASPTLTGLVDGLAARGLVRREAAQEDGRVKRLVATPAGRAINDSIGQKAAAVEEQLLSGFTPAERLLLREWLQRMAQNLGAAPDEACAP